MGLLRLCTLDSKKVFDMGENKMKMCENGGCMSKLSGIQLVQMLSCSGLDLLSEFQDCAILPKAKTDLLFTTDFGPLVGKDCRESGKIAALNAISDIYAMGGIALYASVILVLGNDISKKERDDLLSSVIETCREEMVETVGGHTISGKETIVGLAVIGKMGRRLFRKNNCQVGDALLINKRIGTGIALRGYYNGLLGEEQYQDFIQVMTQSNRLEDDFLELPYIHAMTDITGFGLLGHLSEMLSDEQGADLFLDAIPYVNSILDLSSFALENEFIQNNMDYARERHDIRWHMDTMKKLALCDPQTNGPILVSADKRIIHDIDRYGFYYIGTVTENNKIVLYGK